MLEYQVQIEKLAQLSELYQKDLDSK